MGKRKEKSNEKGKKKAWVLWVVALAVGLLIYCLAAVVLFLSGTQMWGGAVVFLLWAVAMILLCQMQFRTRPELLNATIWKKLLRVCLLLCTAFIGGGALFWITSYAAVAITQYFSQMTQSLLIMGGMLAQTL